MPDFYHQLISCIRLRWRSDVRVLTKPSLLLPMVLMLVVLHVLAEFFGALARSLPAGIWVPVIAMFGVVLGRSLPGWQPLDRGSLARLGCRPGRSWSLATLSLLATIPNFLLLWPLATLFAASGASAPLLLGLVADVLAISCLQAATPVVARRTSVLVLPSLRGWGVISESVTWGIVRWAGCAALWVAIVEAVGCGVVGLLVLSLLHCSRSLIALGCVTVCGVMFGLLPQNAAAMEGAGLWMDLVYMPSTPWSRVGAAIPSVAFGSLSIGGCALLNPSSMVGTVAAGCFALGWSLGIAQLWSVLLPCRVHRAHPQHRTAAPLSRVYLAQLSLLVAVVGPLLLSQNGLLPIRNPAQQAGFGAAAGLGGTLAASYVLSMRGRRLVAYLAEAHGSR